MSEGFVYFLQSSNGSTYIGATVDLDHRLRQHNREIKGGAVATSRLVLQGETWTRVCHVRNFPDWQACLQFEWRWKQLSRKLSSKMNPMKRRLTALKELMGLNQPTSRAIPYSEWQVPPEIIFEKEGIENLYKYI